MFGFVEADCVLDGIKPAVSVDSVGLLVLMGWMNSEYCGLEWEGRSAGFSCTLRVGILQIFRGKYKVVH